MTKTNHIQLVEDVFAGLLVTADTEPHVPGTCRECRFFSVEESDLDWHVESNEEISDGIFVEGCCRRNPPQFHTPLNQERLKEHNSSIGWMLGFWPKCSWDYWCGEFSPLSREDHLKRIHSLQEHMTPIIAGWKKKEDPTTRETASGSCGRSIENRKSEIVNEATEER